jgi:RNA polymerase sigma-70 factor (ECF subfamily)
MFDATGHRIDEPAAPGGEGAPALEREELRVAVRACIDRLPERYRTVLVLRDIEELDTDETARALALSREAVKTRLHRARQALKTLLEREGVASAAQGVGPPCRLAARTEPRSLRA